MPPRRPGAVALADDPAVTHRHFSLGDADDPHLWLDPANGRAMLANIAATLADADPENAASYAANAAAATAALDAQTARIAARLAPLAGTRLIVAHDGLGHFAGRFGLSVVGALTDPGSETASARRLTDLHRLIDAGGADCILAQPGHAETAAATLAADTGLPLVRIDPEGITLRPGPDLYPNLLDALADAVASCAG